ncbi:hypothetical protein BGZ96_004096 [Linnemannia gamsii]|uniref:PPPDE domain-containing protein n=1 Tax=Linnemannia gamsii TaxID=64522 RepID=A0ABQ7K7D4_9FUNG|nr:hypothetical protein BGZ96_004096 [Linnemannia gamsii]
MTRDFRAMSEQNIEELLETARMQTERDARGSISIIYECIDDIKWFPGYRDDDSSPKSKHWKLVIRLGFDCFCLEFVESNQVRHEGLVMVSRYNPDNERRTIYPLGDIFINTEAFYSEIQKMISTYTAYSIITRNCQHFVRDFLGQFEACFRDRTPRLASILDETPCHITKRAILAFIFYIGSKSSTPSP